MNPFRSFKKVKPKQNKGFTLIELIIVIAVIGVLAGAIFVALDPEKRLRDSRNADRYTAVDSILTSIKKYEADNGGELPTEIDETLRMLGTSEDGCDITCGATGGGSGGGTTTVNHDYNTVEDFTVSDDSLIEIDEVNGYAELIDLGVETYSSASPYVELSTAAILSEPDSLDDIDVTYGENNEGTAEFSLKHNGTDKWWNGSAWVTNSGNGTAMSDSNDLWDNVYAHLNMDNTWVDNKNAIEVDPSANVNFIADAQVGTHASNFTETNDVIDIDAYNFGPEFVNSDGGTFSMWLRWTNTNSFQGIISGEQSTGNYRIYMNVNRNGDTFASDPGEVSFYFKSRHSGSNEYMGGGTVGADINDGEWHHVVMTIDPDFSTGLHFSGIQLYIDGEGVNEAVYQNQGPLIMSTSWDQEFILGGLTTGGTSYYEGDMDEVILFDRALTAQEVSDLYDEQSGGKNSNTEAELDTNLSSLSVEDGDTISLISYLISNGSQIVELDEVVLNLTGVGGGEEDGGEETAASCIDISEDLDGYLGSIPVDPLVGTAAKTYYAVKKLDPVGITVKACEVEQDKVIETSR